MILKPETKSRENIRSFVVRAGRMTVGQQRAIDELWPSCGLTVAKGKFSPPDEHTPVILDIGFGMGHALAEMAAQHPEQHYLGVEVYPPGVGSLLAEVKQQDLKNIQVYCADVMLVFENCLPDRCLSGTQIFFPDPWHKKRHHKRRLIQTEFLTTLTQKTKQHGFCHIATDWQPYAEVVKEILDAHPDWQIQTEANFARPETKFERRGQRLGHGVWDIVAINVS